ncbi:hypothetical protein AGOR_G00210540 [Albula goreensis]|uniref:SH3 domain-binding protein 5 n=1 Tax=Albula goreensis TaxID=1534307 RepID=A0A8T3CQN9_9TELE|nr:hypothetical protein AGOR_G00210540 [Albula goreensis]
MEPESLRESPAGSGDPEPGDWRGETPGGEADEKDEGPKDRDGDGGTTDTGDDGGEGQDGDENRERQEEDSKYEEELDPRIQEELEHLNEASEEINRLELQLDDARSGYRKILTESARKLNAQGSQLGTCIEKARPYYEARRLAKEAQQETQKAALSYERAVSMHTAAREMVYVAEQGLLADRNTLDPTWQEMLNHATAKVNEAEEERLRSEREHQRVTQLCQDAEARVQTLQKALKRVIIKSKPYFELKAQFNYILEEHKSKVVQLEERVAKVKTRYSVALRNLEQISEQIHAQRGRRRVASGQTKACGGRSSPWGRSLIVSLGERAEPVGEGLGRKTGWMEQGPETRPGSGLQTIASDLEKCDSVEHLGDFLSDVVSLSGEEGDRERRVREEERAAGRVVVVAAAGPSGQDETGRETQTTGRERQQCFVKQHHRSVSL